MKAKSAPSGRNKHDQSIQVNQTGTGHTAHIHYQSQDASDEEIVALRRVAEAQAELIRIYQNRFRPST